MTNRIRSSLLAFPLLFGRLLCLHQTYASESAAVLRPQPDLTQEELDMLEHIQSSKALAPPKDLVDELTAIVDHQLTTIKGFQEKLDFHEEERLEFSQRFEVMKNVTQNLFSKDIVEYNVLQMEKLFARILEAQREDFERLAMGPDIIFEGGESPVEHDDRDQKEEEDGEEDEVIDSLKNKITKAKLVEILSLESLLELSDIDLLEKIENIIKPYIESDIIPMHYAQFEDKMKQKTIDLDKAKDDVAQILEEERSQDSQCVDTSNALNLIQQSIWKYINNDGLYDHLSNGAVVIYGDEWTSNSYTVPRSMNEEEEEITQIKIDQMKKYIPEDWERFLLPDDISPIFKFIKDPRKYIPTSFWHSFPLPIKKLLSLHEFSAISKPPETIMRKNNNFGSCWAMATTSGKITMRLDHPISIQSVTVDHYPALESAHDEKKDAINRSAPRYFHLIGYPLCDDDNKDTLDCIKLGFDKNRPVDLGSFEYKQHKSSFGDNSVTESDSEDTNEHIRSTQTFILQYQSDKNEDEMAEGSCSETKPTCSSEDGDNHDVIQNDQYKSPIVAAVSFVVDDNWGNDAFTCIYRVRVHGE